MYYTTYSCTDIHFHKFMNRNNMKMHKYLRMHARTHAHTPAKTNRNTQKRRACSQSNLTHNIFDLWVGARHQKQAHAVGARIHSGQHQRSAHELRLAHT